MTALTTRFAGFAAEELWTCQSGEETDEAVFAVLNLDHDRFLTDLADPGVGVGLPVTGEAGAGGDACAAGLRAVTTPTAAPPGSEVARRRSEHRKARARLRVAQDVRMGGCCQLLRANIHGLRRYRSADFADLTAAAVDALVKAPAEHPQDRAARVLQSAWRAHVFRHVFLHLRHVTAQLSAGSARAALQSVNPREALLADAASDIVVRFRLAADPKSPLPVVVYKVFTRRPVVDVCRGCCGRLVLCSSAARAAAAEALGAVRVATAPAWSPSWSCRPRPSPPRPRSVCCLLFSSYERVENNPWRPCRVGLFDPERCPARGTGLARIRARGRGRSRGEGDDVRTSPVRARPRPAAPAVKRKLSPQEKERLSKISLLRRLYGYERAEEVPCPPPPPSVSSRAAPVTPEDGGVLPPSRDGERSRHHVLREDADAHPDVAVEDVEAPVIRSRCLAPSPSDSYYDSLLAAWGM